MLGKFLSELSSEDYELFDSILETRWPNLLQEV